MPLVFAMNSLNRSIGPADLHLLTISEPVGDKLAVIHAMAHERSAS